MANMLTLPLEFFCNEVLPKVLDPKGGPFVGTDDIQHNKWTIARGQDDDTGMDVIVIVQEPIIYKPGESK